MELEINKLGVVFSVNIKDEIPKHADFWRYNYRHWEEETFRIFNRFLESTYDYLDIGAWIGPTVLYGSQKSKHVYAIEPNKMVYNELIENVRLNTMHSHKVTCINAALSPKSGSINLFLNSNNGDSMSSVLSSDSSIESYEIPAITINELAEQYNLDDVNFVKIDIEGAEYELLPSLKSFFQKNKPTLYLSIHPPYLKKYLENKADSNITDAFVNSTKRMLDTLSSYKYIYNTNQELIMMDAIYEESNFNSYVFTDELW
ncbi:FkbM family methyltransferase [Paenibacillus rubinfantis]|uniref:FkbM family methyltransferase n=1 Tax=Paenibacillus rubinfantis TaxID=1720296 RepID=UPI00073F831E|nr:FkbM family methyltransferase [Paenibacillus rubinfantis]